MAHSTDDSEARMTWLNFNPEVHWPFSGAVTQDIRTNLLAKAGNDETEVRVLREVASYGKQIGVISDLLLAVVASVQPKKLGADGERALAQLCTLVGDIQRIKDELRPLPDNPDEARALIVALKERFPELKTT
jgi:hypothetical protein